MPKYFLKGGWEKEFHEVEEGIFYRVALEAYPRDASEIGDGTITLAPDYKFRTRLVEGYIEPDVKPVSMAITPHQQLLLDWIKLGIVNTRQGFGAQVADDLIANKHLWVAVYPVACRPLDMREISRGKWDIDTIYIQPVKAMDENLPVLADNWDADELEWDRSQQVIFPGMGRHDDLMWDKEASGSFLLRVWWD